MGAGAETDAIGLVVICAVIISAADVVPAGKVQLSLPLRSTKGRGRGRRRAGERDFAIKLSSKCQSVKV